MTKKEIHGGTVHKVPAYLRKIFTSRPTVQAVWEDITPLARNEWICWVISVKRKETRLDHIRKLLDKLTSGKRRPCCFPGCAHRKGVKGSA